MRKLREILRLRYEAKMGIRAIARCVGTSHSTISDLLQRATAAALEWPLPEDMDDQALEALLYPGNPPAQTTRPEPDWQRIHTELRRKGVTLQLLWLEYKREHPDGYQYSRFCERYRIWKRSVDVALRQPHAAGEKLFVDWSGLGIKITDPATGDVWEAPVFVAALAASHYLYAEACPDMSLPHWIGAHSRTLAFLGGVPAMVVCDQPRTATRRPDRYDPELHPTYAEWAAHYQTVILPARPGHPRDKAPVETAVQLIQRHVLAPLRHHTFFSVDEANRAIRQLLEALNHRPFQKLAGTRRALFERLDQPALKPLPRAPYEYATWHKARVHIDYHIQVAKSFYSVPYQLRGEQVDVRLAARTVEVLYKGRRVASHARSPREGRYVTRAEHMPAAHRKHLQWSPSRLLRWGHSVGPCCGDFVKALLESRPHPEQGYRACLGLVQLRKQYGDARLEAACRRALALKAYAYRHIRSILAQGLDRTAGSDSAGAKALVPAHANLRGPDYYRDTKEA